MESEPQPAEREPVDCSAHLMMVTWHLLSTGALRLHISRSNISKRQTSPSFKHRASATCRQPPGLSLLYVQDVLETENLWLQSHCIPASGMCTSKVCRSYLQPAARSQHAAQREPIALLQWGTWQQDICRPPGNFRCHAMAMTPGRSRPQQSQTHTLECFKGKTAMHAGHTVHSQNLALSTGQGCSQSQCHASQPQG